MQSHNQHLIDFISTIEDELGKHKWIESEKAGRDVGDHAHAGWLEEHFPAWKRHHWQQAIAEATTA